ncbi:MAG: GNAT family N-acetyltransferase [Paracoccaceae bacterium]
MSAVLQALVLAGKCTSASDMDFVMAQYIAHPDRIDCFVAQGDDGQILGLQSLRLMHKDNPYGAPAGWGFIGTHISPDAARQGVGTRLFAATCDAAENANIPAIEAFIGAKNADGLAYYSAMGFQTHRHADGAVCKSFVVG